MGNIENDKYRGISIFDMQFEEIIRKRIESDEKNKLLNDLADLNAWCQKDESKCILRNRLYDYFEEEIIGAYCRYVTEKKEAWSTLKNLCADFGTALIPIASGLCLFWFSKDNMWTVGTVSLIVGTMLAVVWFLLVGFQNARRRKAYSETWVRHSACYGRLRLSLSKFLTSNREDSDYFEFVEDVFLILEQNYDQFTANLSTNAVVFRKNNM